jgi:hypothetical protein
MDIKLCCYRVTHEKWFKVFCVQVDVDTSVTKIVIVERYNNSTTIE